MKKWPEEKTLALGPMVSAASWLDSRPFVAQNGHGYAGQLQVGVR